MSRVYFHTPSGDAELRGSERAYAGITVDNLTLGILDCDGYRMRELLLPCLPPDSYLHSMDRDQWRSGFETWWRVGFGDSSLTIGGQTFSTWHLSLNTALAAGSDPIVLLARMHATCEIHGYLEGQHRGWFADIIEEGRTDKILRGGQGWEDVVCLLRKTSDEPVVMSYSVCDSFPYYDHLMPPWPEGVPVDRNALTEEQRQDREIAQEEIEALWYPYPDEGQGWTDEQKWDSAYEHLVKVGEGNIDITPESWRTRGFGDGQSVFDFLEVLHEEGAS